MSKEFKGILKGSKHGLDSSKGMAKWDECKQLTLFRPMAEVVCLCNEILDVDLREYLDSHPIDSIDELRDQASICNKCMQCQELVEGEIYQARMRRQRAAGQPS
jgi:bacterioferritin-associated ferredoxin